MNLVGKGHIQLCSEQRSQRQTSSSPTTNLADDLYLQNSFSLDPPAVARPLLLRGWDACLGLLGFPSDSSAGLEGDNPQTRPPSSLGERTHVSLELGVLSLLTDRQGLSWIEQHRAKNQDLYILCVGST